MIGKKRGEEAHLIRGCERDRKLSFPASPSHQEHSEDLASGLTIHGVD